MLRCLTTGILVIVLLACPQLCRANVSGCCGQDASVSQACCEHCQAPDPAAASDELPAPGNSDKPCAACLCKGAVLIQTVVDLSIANLSLDTLPPVNVTVAIVAAQGSSIVELLSPSHDWRDSCGLGARIALDSLIC